MSLIVNSFHTPITVNVRQSTSDIWKVIAKAHSILNASDREKFFETDGHAEIERHIRAGALLNQRGALPLNEALKIGFHPKTIESMLKDGKADPLFRDSDGNTAFFCTVDVEIWKLLQTYSRKSFREIAMETNLAGHCLATHIVERWTEADYTLAALDYLLGCQASIPADVVARHPKILSKLASSPQSAERLIKMGFPVEFSDVKPLTQALVHCQWPFAALLIRHGATFDREDWRVLYSYLNCVMHIDKSRKDLAAAILEKIDMRRFGWSSLHFAAFTGLNEQILKLLSDDSFWVDTPCNDNNFTPLHLAARQGQILSTFYLLEMGKAEPFIADGDGQMPKAILRNHPLHELLSIYRDIANPLDRKAATLRWVADNLAQTTATLRLLRKDPKWNRFEIEFYDNRWQELMTIQSILRIPSKL